VQGPGAAAEIAVGLADVQTIPEVDVVIVGRGGGSLEDLWAFNEEVVARAIAASRVPVVSAVGHEIDFTIADFVADVRAATPTAAAALVVPDRRALLGQVADAGQRLRDAVVRRTAWDRRELDRLAARLGRFEPGALVAAQRARLARDAERLRRTIERRVHAVQAAVAREEARLLALSPLACLERGYAIVRRDDAGAAVVRDATTLARGESVRLVLARGRARAHIDSTEG
jgi:exodeoxyribonuclease VII large subunit